MCSIDLVITKDLSSLRKEEKGLVLHQQVGAFFTKDYRRHCGGITNCPMCGMQDSRVHRLDECQSVVHIRRFFPNLISLWSTLIEYERYFGISPEPASMRTWQARLDRIPWPTFHRNPCPGTTLVYTDGGCLFPYRWSHIRLAAYASIIPCDNGSFEVLAHGLLPGSCQSAFRAEIMASVRPCILICVLLSYWIAKGLWTLVIAYFKICAMALNLSFLIRIPTSGPCFMLELVCTLRLPNFLSFPLKLWLFHSGMVLGTSNLWVCRRTYLRGLSCGFCA